MKNQEILYFVLQLVLFRNILTSLTNQSISNVAQVSQISNVINTATVQIPNPPVIDLSSKFIQTSLLGNDVGVGPEGDIYVVGIDGKLYIYNFATSSYSRVIADPDLDGIIRVDVDDEGTPFVVTNCGATYYLSCDGRWIQLPGCASDIGAGFCGQVWKTGCDVRDGGFGIWKLFCTGKEKKCNRYRQFNYGSKYNNRINERKKCYWYRVTGAGNRIDVYPDGKPAVVQNSGLAMKYNGNEWSIITQYSGRDITISNEGVALMTGINGGLFLIPENSNEKEGFFDERYNFNEFGATYVKNQSILDKKTKYVDVGCTMAVSSGPFSQPALIPCISTYDPVVILTQKFDYN